ncbi:MAG: alpha/beta hydrolase [Pseudomonadota bacterium]
MRRALKILAGVIAIVLIALAGVVIHANHRINKEEVLSADTDAPGRYMSIEGHRWHVLTVGNVKADTNGPPILLIHGFSPVGHLMWQPWADKLAAQRALIMPDNLGYGYSERNTTPGPYYTIKSYSDSLAAILDQLGVAQVEVIGHSFGGAIAARFALDYPTRVRRIVFIDAAVYYERTASDNIIQWPLGIGRAVAWHVTGGGPSSIITRFCKAQSSDRCLRLLRVKDSTDTIRAMMYTYHHSPDAEALVNDLPKLSSPSLVIWGANDPFFPASKGVRLAKEIKSDLVLIDRGYHMPYLYAPDKVATRVLDFLNMP